MVCSTAARSGFRIIFSKSYDISLQLLTLLSLRTSLNNLSTILDLPGFPPSLQVSLSFCDCFLMQNSPFIKTAYPGYSTSRANDSVQIHISFLT